MQCALTNELRRDDIKARHCQVDAAVFKPGAGSLFYFDF
jgi:hypothetical protein